MERDEVSVTVLIRARLGECSPAERKVARVLLAGLPAVGFETVAAIAERAGVSGPTVLRLLARLGFGGLPGFQQALRRELDDRQASPLALYDARADDHGEPAALIASALRRTVDGLPRADLDRVVALLADVRRRPLLVGGRFSRLLAAYLHLHLVQLREGAVLLPEDDVVRAATLAGVGGRDVLVVFDFRRYEPRLLALARVVRSRGGTVVLVTDRWLSPVAEVAAAVLACEVDAPSAYDSLVPAMAVVETVVTGVLAARGDEALARMAACEEAARAASLLE